MFQTGELKNYDFLDQGTFKGRISVNSDFDFTQNFTRPFIRNKQRQIISIGKIDMAKLDNFIAGSLNDLFKRLQKKDTYEVMVKRNQEYQTLYALWQQIAVAKQNNDFALNAYYDDIIYRLYINGYKLPAEESNQQPSNNNKGW